jgi:hypothetical protein
MFVAGGGPLLSTTYILELIVVEVEGVNMLKNRVLGVAVGQTGNRGVWIRRKKAVEKGGVFHRR